MPASSVLNIMEHKEQSQDDEKRSGDVAFEEVGIERVDRVHREKKCSHQAGCCRIKTPSHQEDKQYRCRAKDGRNASSHEIDNIRMLGEKLRYRLWWRVMPQQYLRKHVETPDHYVEVHVEIRAI